MEEKKDVKNVQNTRESANNSNDKKLSNGKKMIAGVACVVVVAGAIVGISLNKDKIFSKNNSDTNQTEQISVNEDADVSDMDLIEEGYFYFYAPKSWECKIERNQTSPYKLNDSDDLYEVSGKVNGEYNKAISILVSDDLDGYSNSSWGYVGLYNGDRHIFVMKNFVCRDGSGEEYTDEDYKFERETNVLLDSFTVKYDVTNEFGSVNDSKTLEGLYFTRGEEGISMRPYVYYINQKTLYRTQLTDEFPTDLLASNVDWMNYYDEKLHVYVESEGISYDSVQEDENVEYIPTRTEQTTDDNNVSHIVTNTEEVKIEEDAFYFYVPGLWECKVEEMDSTIYKSNDDDKYYEISGKVNGEYKTAVSVSISNGTEGYSESSWYNYGRYNKDKYIFVMNRFQIKDEDGKLYTEADYKFEEETIKLMESFGIKYEIENEFGEIKTLEGVYFITDNRNNPENEFIYYIKERKLYRTDIKNDFKTEVLATNVSNMEYLEYAGKIHVYPNPGTTSYGKVIDDDYVEYQEIR